MALNMGVSLKGSGVIVIVNAIESIVFNISLVLGTVMMTVLSLVILNSF